MANSLFRAFHDIKARRLYGPCSWPHPDYLVLCRTIITRLKMNRVPDTPFLPLPPLCVDSESYFPLSLHLQKPSVSLSDTASATDNKERSLLHSIAPESPRGPRSLVRGSLNRSSNQGVQVCDSPETWKEANLEPDFADKDLT